MGGAERQPGGAAAQKSVCVSVSQGQGRSGFVVKTLSVCVERGAEGKGNLL